MRGCGRIELSRRAVDDRGFFTELRVQEWKETSSSAASALASSAVPPRPPGWRCIYIDSDIVNIVNAFVVAFFDFLEEVP